jgi:hypothetical protein
MTELPDIVNRKEPKMIKNAKLALFGPPTLNDSAISTIYKHAVKRSKGLRLYQSGGFLPNLATKCSKLV